MPLTGHVLPDVLSEGTFLLFWTWGLYAALRFLREGSFAWLPPTIGFAALAYLARPEGLLLPMALVACLAAMPILRSTRMLWPRWWAAVGFLVIGPALLVGPYVAMKGGLGTKPAIARLLGTAPKSAATAVERAPAARPESDHDHDLPARHEGDGRVGPRRGDDPAAAAGAGRLRPRVAAGRRGREAG